MRKLGNHGAKAKIAALRTAGATRYPMTNVHTPNPPRAQPRMIGNVTTAPMSSACAKRSNASRLRSKLSETMRQATIGKTRDMTGRTSARRGTANQSAITGAPRERAAQNTMAIIIVIQKQVSSSRRSRSRNWMIADPKPISASIPA
jgi:hypothetical protein